MIEKRFYEGRGTKKACLSLSVPYETFAALCYLVLMTNRSRASLSAECIADGLDTVARRYGVKLPVTKNFRREDYERIVSKWSKGKLPQVLQ